MPQNDTIATNEPKESTSLVPKASVVFKSLTFSDGSKVDLNPNDIVVFVGPNNSGKTSALYALDSLIGENVAPTKVVASVEISQKGTLEDLFDFLGQNFKTVGEAPIRQFYGIGCSVDESYAKNFWYGPLRGLSRFFCFMIRTDQRLADSNFMQTPDVEQVPQHPIQVMFFEDEIERRISGYFKKVFGQDLSVFRMGGSQMSLLVGERPELQPGEDRLSVSYNRRLRSETSSLHEQGDGMRSFVTVLLRTLVSTSMSILLLDEPEAFLHPPQARYLAEVIAKERTPGTQLFMATHSEDILQGLLNATPSQLRIIRLTRAGSINKVKELNNDLAVSISSDPLMRFTSVLSGIFHERVIICESDSDCMFYSSILNVTGVHGSHSPDVLFIHPGGKHRLAALAKTLRALDVKVDVIADIDILNDLQVLEHLVVVLGGDWNSYRGRANSVKSAVEQRKSWLDVTEVAKDIRAILERAPSSGVFPKELRQDIKEVFAKASPWDALKTAGRSAIPPGEATQQYEALESLCSQIGLWIVPVGEMEGFCRSEGKHGPRWVQNVFEKYSPGDAPELFTAREFMRQLWNRT